MQQASDTSKKETTAAADEEQTRIVEEETGCLSRVLHHIDNREVAAPQRSTIDHDAEMLSLRDQIANARVEDVPPLVEQMERLQMLAAARRRETTHSAIDPRSPYFGRLLLEENGRRREVLIGRGTHLDVRAGVRIVDWRDAPVSRIYYRYDEGDDYDEEFGEREVTGEVLVRRTVTINERELRRIVSPQGTFAKRKGEWQRLSSAESRLSGGQGLAPRPDAQHQPGKLGIGADDTGEDKHLREITALIDKRQFDLITHPDSGLVVIQGGAGSGKTTIGLHRMAYLAFQDPRRFRNDRMLVIVFNDALARYISQVLPALGVAGVGIRTYETWAEKLRSAHIPRLPRSYSDETPTEATRLKKHPLMLEIIDQYIVELAGRIESKVEEALERGSTEAAKESLLGKLKADQRPLAHRVHALERRLREMPKNGLPTDTRIGLERAIRSGFAITRDVVSAWAELLTDRARLQQAFEAEASDSLSRQEVGRAVDWCTARIGEVISEREEQAETENAHVEREPKRGRAAGRDNEDDAEQEQLRQGIDGRAVEEATTLDREDDTLLLRLVQRMQGPLRRGGKLREPVVYEHVFVDEAQDLSPVELAVVLDTVSKAQCVTLAGDVAQRLMMDNGFTGWDDTLRQLGLSHVEIEPLKLSYRSTIEIIDFAQAVLGPLATDDHPVAMRGGAPVELFSFSHTGDAVGFLAEVLRDLVQSEPRASVAIISRYIEHADLYYEGLRKAEVMNVRRVAEQDFSFKPGIDVTDVRQVKGLEFDYVVLVETNDSVYPPDVESRHLLHIAATRAAHQLWVLCSNRPSPLLPKGLVDRSL